MVLSSLHLAGIIRNGKNREFSLLSGYLALIMYFMLKLNNKKDKIGK